MAQTGGTGQYQPDVDVGGKTITLNHNARVYLAKDCDDSFKPEMFYQFKLMDKTIQYTLDLSNVGCACNAALYLVSMPAYNISQEADPTRCNDYYCDANKVCDDYCPEIDLCEANNRNIHVTPHQCDAPDGKYYAHCDGGGYSKSAYSINPASFGPGSNYTIDTTREFNISHKFQSSGGTLVEVTNTMSQGTNSFTMVHDKADYLKPLTGPINNGMVLVMSYWGNTGSGMSWLDIPPCDISTDCKTDTQVPFSNIMVY